MRLLIIISLSFICYNGHCQSLEIGQKTPSLEIEKVLNKNVTLNFYKDKYLILDFWSTWCAPCIGSFPHINELAKKINKDKVTIAILSDESPEKVNRFFQVKKQYAVDAVKAIDRVAETSNSSFRGKTFHNYSVTSIPQIFIIDPNGILVWHGTAEELDETLIENVINGKVTTHTSPHKPVSVSNEVIQVDSTQINGFKVKAIVQENLSTYFMMNTRPQMMVEYSGMNISQILSNAFKMNEKQVIIESKNLNKPIKLNLSRNIPTTSDSISIITLQALSAFYHFKYTFPDEYFDVYEIVLEDPKKLLLKAAPFDSLSGHSGSGQTGKYSFGINYQFEQIKGLLSIYNDSFLVINPKNLDIVKNRKFDFRIPISNFKVTKEFLLKVYGIKLRKTRIKLNSLHVFSK